jgi:hypothetical protein
MKKNIRKKITILHWTISTLIAIVMSSVTYVWDLPLCMGCLLTQCALWIRVFSRQVNVIKLCFFSMLFFQGVMFFQQQTHSDTCMFSMDGFEPCWEIPLLTIGGVPFIVYSFIGTLILFVLAFYIED